MIQNLFYAFESFQKNDALKTLNENLNNPYLTSKYYPLNLYNVYTRNDVHCTLVGCALDGIVNTNLQGWYIELLSRLTGCPKINEQFETAGIQSVFKIFSKTQLSDHHKIWPFYKLLRFLKSVKF